MPERIQIPLRLPADILKKVDALARKQRRALGGSWSRNAQIVWMLKDYYPMRGVEPTEKDRE